MLDNDPGRRRSAASSPGRRERNKEKKLQRIVRAGRALFVQKGFDETTTRAIAAKADVGVGTFFTYFAEKLDLLFHLFKEEVSSTEAGAFASIPGDAPLADQLAHVFGAFYDYYGRDVRLSRVLLRELLFLEPGKRGEMLAYTMRFIGRVTELVVEAQARGEVPASVEPRTVSEHAFSLYVAGLIAWVSGAFATPELVREHLKGQIEVLLRGVRAAPPGARRS
jgi:AcrR family transcriptional regulator